MQSKPAQIVREMKFIALFSNEAGVNSPAFVLKDIIGKAWRLGVRMPTLPLSLECDIALYLQMFGSFQVTRFARKNITIFLQT